MRTRLRATVDGRSSVAVVAKTEPPEAGSRAGRLGGHLVGEGAPPALRGGVVDLLHHPFAVPGPRRADLIVTP